MKKIKGTIFHALGASAMVTALFFHPFPWTSFVIGTIGGYLREQQYLHGINKMVEIYNADTGRQVPTRNIWTLDGSGHKWLEALGWGIGAAITHTLLWLFV